MGIRLVRNVPADEVGQWTQYFLEAGATSVEPIPEGDGEFTLKIISPDEERLADFTARTGEAALAGNTVA